MSLSLENSRGSQGALLWRSYRRSALADPAISSCIGMRHSSSYHTGLNAAIGVAAAVPTAVATESTGTTGAVLAIDLCASVGAYYVPAKAVSMTSIPHSLASENLKRQELQLRMQRPAQRGGTVSRTTSELLLSGHTLPLEPAAPLPSSNRYWSALRPIPSPFNLQRSKRSSSQPVLCGDAGTFGQTAERQPTMFLNNCSKSSSGAATRSAGMCPPRASRFPLTNRPTPGTSKIRGPKPFTAANRGHLSGVSSVGPRAGIASGRTIGASIPTHTRCTNSQWPLTFGSKTSIGPFQEATGGSIQRSASRDSMLPSASTSAASQSAACDSLRWASLQVGTVNSNPNPGAQPMPSIIRRPFAETWFQNLRAKLTAVKLGIASIREGL